MSNDTIPIPDRPLASAPIASPPDAITVRTSNPPPTTFWQQQPPHVFSNQSNAGHPKGKGPLRWTLLSVLLIVIILVGGTLAYVGLALHGQFTLSALTGQPAHTHLPATLIAAAIPAGKQLYGTRIPGSSCDLHGGQWSKQPNVQINCGPSATELRNTGKHFLAGTFLDGLPGGFGIPDDYILQVQVRQNLTARGPFGVFFRNQPGVIHQGTFSFLLSPPGNWQVNFYNDASGRATLLATGPTTVPIGASTTIDIVVHGNTFTFYLDGVKQGMAISQSYPSGTLGLAVDVGADVFFSNLALYRLV